MKKLHDYHEKHTCTEMVPRGVTILCVWFAFALSVNWKMVNRWLLQQGKGMYTSEEFSSNRADERIRCNTARADDPCCDAAPKTETRRRIASWDIGGSR